jgi:hypothetical protein
MAKKPVKAKPAARKPPVKIPLSFDAAMSGILGMTPETAKKVNKKVADKRRAIDGRKKP